MIDLGFVLWFNNEKFNLIGLVMIREKGRNINFVVTDSQREILRKLAKLQNRSMTGVVLNLIQEESMRYGLIETRVKQQKVGE